MGENLPSTLLKGEIFKWEKDGDGRKSAMKALMAHLEQLDPKALPVFLAEVSDAKGIGSISWEYMIWLYEVVARVHGLTVVPHVDKIMKSVITTLDANVVSSPLQQACSKVDVAIARYGIEPTTLQDEKRHIVHSQCKPLSDSLSGSRESLTSGAALCLEALDIWTIGSLLPMMVNRLSQNVVVALGEKSTQSDPHMDLAMSLAEHNPLIFEAYTRLLIQSGLQILCRGITKENSHKWWSDIQMIHILMKCLDPRSVYSELKLITEVMESLHSDAVQFVSGAALENLENARKTAAEEEMKLEKDSCSITGSNFRHRRGGRRNGPGSSSDRSSRSVSPESLVVDEYSLEVESSILLRVASPGLNSDGQSVNKKLWRFENAGVDISLKDGLFSGDSANQALDKDMGYCIYEFQVHQ